MMMFFDIQSISLLITLFAFVPLIIGVVVFVSGDKIEGDIFYFLLTIVLLVWIASLAGFQIAETRALSAFLLKLSSLAGMILVLALTYTSIALGLRHHVPLSWVAFLSLVPLLITIAIIFGEVSTVGPLDPTNFGKETTDSPFFIFMIFYMAIYCLASFIILYKEYMKNAGVFRQKNRNIAITVLVASIATVFTNAILPIFDMPQFFFVGPIAACLGASYLGYFLVSHKRRDMKVFFAEVFFGLVVFVLSVSLLFSEALIDRVMSGIFLLVGCVAGYILLSSVKEESKNAKKINKMLEKTSTQNEKLQALNRRNSVFITTTANQLRDPLSGIRWHSVSILSGTYGEVPEAAKEYVERIFESSKRLIVIVDDFLSLRKIEQKEMEYHFTDFDLKDLVCSVVKEMQGPAENQGLRLSYTDDGKGEYKFLGDHGKLRQVVSNLVDNALKYTAEGYVQVSLKQEEESILLRVKDSGMGMAPSEAGLLFRKFSRLSQGKKVNTTGSGLGLYVAQEMVRAHDGEIWAESSGAGKGSTFILRLPMKRK